MDSYAKYYDLDERCTSFPIAPIHANTMNPCRFGSDEWKKMMKEIARSQLLPPVDMLIDIRDPFENPKGIESFDCDSNFEQASYESESDGIFCGGEEVDGDSDEDSGHSSE